MLELPLDPWGLLSGGRCQGGQALAFATVCVTEEERGTEFLANCLASICALLATTDPECVVAIVSSWVYHAARHVLLRNGVLPLVAPTWLPHHVGHPFEHIHWKPHFSAKLEAFRLTGHDRVVWFDPDVLFMRNASGLLGVPGEFAASTSPKGKDPARYVNDGVMVFTPSIGLYNELITRWRDGSHSLHYSEDEVSDNDLVMEVCVLEGKCGAVSDLDACLYNHGVWLPLRYWRPCPSRAAVARHNFLATREPILTGVLHAAALRGTCRARAVPDPAAEGCWEGADEHGPFTAERCCRDAARGGDLQCWGHGKGFESCCRGARDAEHLQAELRAVGQSWYGLSSQPDRPRPGHLGARCWRQYHRMRHTLFSLGAVASGTQAFSAPEAAWRPWGEAWGAQSPPGAVLLGGIKCISFGDPRAVARPTRFVVFRFRFDAYFGRHRADSKVAAIWRGYSEDARLRDRLSAMAACVPQECCFLQPEGSNASAADGLRSVLFRFVFDFLFSKFGMDLGAVLPEPAESDFNGIFTMNPQDPSEAWQKCFRD